MHIHHYYMRTSLDANLHWNIVAKITSYRLVINVVTSLSQLLTFNRLNIKISVTNIKQI